MAPNCTIGFIVVGNPAATVITSSKGFIALSLSFGEVRLVNAIKFADDPEFTVINCLIPINFASFFSKSLLNLPAVSQPSRKLLPYFVILNHQLLFLLEE